MTVSIKKILEEKLHYCFKDTQIMIVAFTHSSYANEKDIESNEKLEFLGDSILSFVVAELLYKKYPNKNEGVYSKIRSKAVSTETLSKIIEALDISSYMLVGNSTHNSSKMSQRKIHANLFEAITGGIFIDCGLESAKKFVLASLENIIDDLMNADLISDYKTALQEYGQKNKEDKIEFKLVSKEGPDHNPTFTFEVLINGVSFGIGSGVNKSQAQLNAAEIAYKKLIVKT